ncbi:metallo proteinase [Sodiomyces alkalinus F11]|uniref:Neutral protease 2 n=1 Tax=Sodiomyces alkalinus (strain CBS 110278 / VKM F-3762 / F11) TaxID=1314773 RepID=A0A3N2Q239_SODAK|nr:metallo proteinase [Sodiomyces alkalinus F11]ROT40802.1 metallo proteinase [Sodiomyces alkalinus F11]
MKFLASVSFLAALASAAVVDITRRETESPLEVKIELSGNSAVRASITNTGSSAIKVLKTGSILDTVEVEKSQVFLGNEKIAFDGVRLMVDTAALTEESFRLISAGETVEVEWDVAIGHDLSAGGDFDFTTAGALSYAEEDSTEIAGVVPYSSNVLHAHVDGEAAAMVRREFHDMLEKRFAVQSDCSGTQRTATVNAISACRSLAVTAASWASSGSAAKMNEFFKSSTSATRSTVVGVFNRIASECGSTTSGARQHCRDIYPGGACSNGVVAYAVPAQNYVVNCPYYFTFPARSGSCYGISHASTTLHEATHLRHVAGTTDYCYGYSCVQRLSTAQNLNNADTYALYAQSIYAGC